MGAWFAHFLSSQGFAIEVADPSPAAVAFPRVADWRDDALDHDLIIVATPMKVAGEVLTELAARRPRGVVVDIGSLKSPLRSGLERLVAAGCKVTSIHPMFGPDTRLLSGRHVVFCDVGVPEATRAARALFASTMAEQIEMSVDDHDRLMAYVLGLSHALNLGVLHGARRERRARAAVADECRARRSTRSSRSRLWSRATIRICTSTSRR